MFKKGDILEGKKRGKDEALHFIVFISGPDLAPLAVVLTSVSKYSCNIQLNEIYNLNAKGDKITSYFVAHIIEKMPEWGSYKKIGELTEDDLKLIEIKISTHSMTWKEYLKYTKGGCPIHDKNN